MYFRSNIWSFKLNEKHEKITPDQVLSKIYNKIKILSTEPEG